ncbi:MAG: VWA domain-containing protein [Chloroherpetonaceae bacterium]|nr:VWA domain-containing protein [Chthonomonadaceae bacterium]MDW8208714.1 VWA domain-containing protein [Chloroherpetonaceae bacterium]
MGLSSPLYLLWFLPPGVLILLLYLLKKKRREVVISSTLLWEQVLQDVQAHTPFQKLRRHLLLWLQLLLAALLVLAISGPYVRVTGTRGRNIAILIDVSASMQATDVTPSRLEVAKRNALERIDRLGPGDRMMIIACGWRPEVLTGFTADRVTLRQAVRSLRPQDTPGNLREALRFSSDLVAAERNGVPGRIEVFSDGDGLPAVSEASSSRTGLSRDSAEIVFHPIGRRSENVGIVTIDYRRSSSKAGVVQLLVVTRNFGEKPRTFTQEISVEERLVDAAETVLAPHATRTFTYDLPDPDRPVRVRAYLDLRDDLAVDNHAMLVLNPIRRLKTLLIGRENLFLENALRVDPSVALSTAASFVPEQADEYDVVVFSEVAPAHLPPGNYLFLHCHSEQAPVSVTGEERNVMPIDWERDHPVLRFVDLGQERFDRALQATPRAWGQEIATATSGTLIAVGEHGDTRTIFLGFALDTPSFALRVAFPILIANCVRWLGTGNDAYDRTQAVAGKPVSLSLRSAGSPLTVTAPDGSRRTLHPVAPGRFVLDHVERIGFYQIAGAGVSHMVAVNLTDEQESDLRPRPHSALPSTAAEHRGARVIYRRSWLPVVVTAALIILMVEWWVYHRRIYQS